MIPGMMQKMQEMQRQLQENMQRAQAELAQLQIEGHSEGSKVVVMVNGHQEVSAIRIDPSLIQPDEVGTLEDMVLAAIRDAITKSKQASAEKMNSLTQGLPIPPGLFQ